MISVTALLGQSRIVDRRGGAVGGQLQQRYVLLAEFPAVKRADVHHADHTTLDLQRHAEHRADPALAQERVDYFGAAEILDHDRAHLGGDLSGEPSRNGYLDALADLLLQTARSTRDEHLAVLVEQKDRGGVDAENAARSLEQLA